MAYTRQLFDQGKIVLGGAATDGAIGIIVWRVDSAEEMQRIYENDPAMKAGIGRSELHPFRIGHLSGLEIRCGNIAAYFNTILEKR